MNRSFITTTPPRICGGLSIAVGENEWSTATYYSKNGNRGEQTSTFNSHKASCSIWENPCRSSFGSAGNSKIKIARSGTKSHSFFLLRRLGERQKNICSKNSRSFLIFSFWAVAVDYCLFCRACPIPFKGSQTATIGNAGNVIPEEGTKAASLPL